MFKRAWDSKLVMAVRAASEVYGFASMLVAIGGTAIVPAAIVGAIAFLGNAPWPLVALIGIGGYVIAFVAVLFLLPRMPQVQKQVKEKELRRQCCELSEELVAFLAERAPDHPQKKFESAIMDPSEEDASGHLQDAMRYNQETEDQYNEQFGREVERLLDALERRGWSDPEKRKRLGNQWWVLPDDWIQRIAQHLQRVAA